MTIRPATTADIGNLINENECIWIAEAEGVSMGFAVADAEDSSVFCAPGVGEYRRGQAVAGEAGGLFACPA